LPEITKLIGVSPTCVSEDRVECVPNAS